MQEELTALEQYLKEEAERRGQSCEGGRKMVARVPPREHVRGHRRQKASCELISGKLDHRAALGRPSIKVERDVIVGRASVIGFLGVYPALAELMHAATMISMCMGRHCDEVGAKEIRRR